MFRLFPGRTFVKRRKYNLKVPTLFFQSINQLKKNTFSLMVQRVLP